MRRFFLPGFNPDNDSLPREITHHAKTVLRLRSGSVIVLCDGAGHCYECYLEDLDAKSCPVRVIRQWTEAETALPVTLIQGVPHSDKWDLILQKTTELGVHQILPVHTERCQFPIPAAKQERKLERWQKIVAEASRQSERAWLPNIGTPTDLATALQSCDATLKLVLWEDADLPLKSVLPPQPPASVAFVVGPEGGLCAHEVALARDAGFVPVGLGPRILRTETAGLTLLAILQYLYGDLDRIARERD